MIRDDSKPSKRGSLAHASIWENPEARRVLDSMTELFFAIDRKHDVLFVNRATLERNSRVIEEYLGKNHWELWPEMRGTVVEESYTVAFATGVPVRFEHYYEPTNVWVDVNAYPYGDQLHIYFRDITDQKMAEFELSQREQDLRTLLDAIPHVAWAIDSEGKLEYINARWCEFTGQDNIEQALVHSAIHPEDIARVEEIMRRCRASGVPESYDCRVRSKTGEYRWLRVKWSPLLGMDGKPKRWIGTSTDVHDEVLALNALREAEDHSQFRTETSPQIPWLAGPDGMIYEHGPQWEKLTGLTADDMPESQMLVLHPEDAPAMIITWSRCLETGEPFDCEHRIKVKTGEYRWMRSQAVARKGADDQILRWYGTTEDIHERKSAVHALLESEERYRSLAESLELLVQERTSELEAAYREQESFSYSVSHDLRAPLRSIVSSARILDEDYGSNLPDEAKLMLDRQAHAALRLAHLIDDLLELSRVGRKELTKTNVDVTELFTIVSTSIEKPETLRFSIEQNLRANGDARLLQLLAQNLVENAVKFSPNGGLVRIGRSPEDGAFFISDQGVGFRQEYSAKLFLPFHRLHTDEEFPGTGIGLASVKRIVERHGGRIWAEGEVGKGATFYFILA